MCVCVCVCARESEREIESGSKTHLGDGGVHAGLRCVRRRSSPPKGARSDDAAGVDDRVGHVLVGIRCPAPEND